MKRTYVKPQIIFENFVLSSNIAGDCEIKTYTPNNSTCGYQPEGLDYTIFTTDISGCYQKVDDDEANGFCYHVPIESNNLFNS